MRRKLSSEQREKIIADLHTVCRRESKNLADATENLRQYSELMDKLPQADVNFYNVLGESLVMVRLAFEQRAKLEKKRKPRRKN